MDDFSHWKDGKELDDDATISTTHPKKSPFCEETPPGVGKGGGRFFEKRPLFFSIPSAPSSMLLYFQNRSAKNLTMRNDILIFYCYFCHAT